MGFSDARIFSQALHFPGISGCFKRSFPCCKHRTSQSFRKATSAEEPSSFLHQVQLIRGAHCPKTGQRNPVQNCSRSIHTGRGPRRAGLAGEGRGKGPQREPAPQPCNPAPLKAPGNLHPPPGLPSPPQQILRPPPGLLGPLSVVPPQNPESSRSPPRTPAPPDSGCPLPRFPTDTWVPHAPDSRFPSTPPPSRRLGPVVPPLTLQQADLTPQLFFLLHPHSRSTPRLRHRRAPGTGGHVISARPDGPVT